MKSNIEFETKVLEIDVDQIVKLLQELGAVEEPETFRRVILFDMESENIEWIRLRDEKGKTTMTYKYKTIGNTAIGKTEEIEVVVSDFDKTRQILSKLKFRRVLYQENKVHIFRLNNIEYSIATWPKIKPYLEVEGHSEEDVKRGLEILNLSGKDAGDLDIAEIYKKVGLDLNSVAEMKFE